MQLTIPANSGQGTAVELTWRELREVVAGLSRHYSLVTINSDQ